MVAAYLTVHLVPGEPRQRCCDRCLTSAAVDIPVYALIPDGPTQVGTVTTCTRCDQFDAATAAARMSADVQAAVDEGGDLWPM